MTKTTQQNEPASLDRSWGDCAPRLSGWLVALALLVPAQAWADGTLVVRPTGNAKQHNIDKVTAAITAKARGIDDMSIGSVEVSADCVADLSCLASAGRDQGASVVVGVLVTRSSADFVLSLVAVDAVSGVALGRHDVQNIRRKTLPDMSGDIFQKFLATLAAAPPAPVALAQTEAVAEQEAAEPALAEPALEEPNTEPNPEPEAVAEQRVDVRVAVPETGASHASYAIELGLVTGVVLPQISSELSTTAGIEFDLGVPVWKALSLIGGVGYSQPAVDSSLNDPRIDSGAYSTETTQRELMLTLGGTWRFLPASKQLNVYAGLGGRIWLLETLTNGSADGMDFGENQERSTRYGAAAWAGAEFLLGPGALIAELDLGGSDLPHLVTGDVATTAIALQVGYRLRL